jgi:hypothetical protein
MPAAPEPVRERGFGDFSTLPPDVRGGKRQWLMRAQNFTVEWVEFGDEATPFEFASEFETLLLAVRGTLQVLAPSPLRAEGRGEGRSATDAADSPTNVPPDAFAIVPAGHHAVRAGAGASCVLIASQRGDLAGRNVIAAEGYAKPDARIAPTGQPFRRAQPTSRVEVLPIAQVMASPDKPRLKMLQTETLSINIVDYPGARDRSALSPHSHQDFEQGSLAVAGEFVHHLRTPWGSDANGWREDEHLAARSPSLVVVPVEMIHTTEGVGAGRHLLLDVFSPPRFDFIRNGWVFNARSYVATVPQASAS